MARQQRKKSQDEKRKKKQTPTPAAVASGGNGGTAAIPAVKDSGKKPMPPARKAPSAVKTPSGKVSGWIHQSVQFLREVKVELKKVTWPSRKQTVGSTVVVLILVTIIATFLGLVDIGLSSLIQIVLQ